MVVILTLPKLYDCRNQKRMLRHYLTELKTSCISKHAKHFK